MNLANMQRILQKYKTKTLATVGLQGLIIPIKAEF